MPPGKPRNPSDFIDLVFNLPKMVRLHYRLFKDSRTPLIAKAVLIGALIYVVSPIDLLPDLVLPIIGQVDDVIVLIYASRYFLKKCPPELVLEHMRAIENRT